MKDPNKVTINKRQASQIARLLTASYNSMTDTPDAPDGINADEWGKVIECINESGWRTLEALGFDRALHTHEIIAHVLKR